MPNPDSLTQTVPGSTSGGKPAGPTVSEPTRSTSTSSLSVTQTIVAPSSASLVRIQWVVVGVMIAIAVFAGARLWMLEGLVRVARVDGPSMAPAFLGGHYRVTCEDCGFVWRCDAEHAPASREASCPNCGYPTNTLRDEDLVPGELVLIDHWPLAVRGVRRGEVVAAPDPAHAGGVVIKRVAAQPRERLEIRGGDFVVDGELVRKSWQELAQVRVLVHDNSFQPKKTTGMPDRWVKASDESAWHSAMTGFRCVPARPDDWHWLEYAHHQMFGWRLRTRRSPVLDLDSYNPSETRLLNAVPDVQLSCRLRNLGGGKGQIGLAAIDGGQRFEALIDPRRQTADLVAIDAQGQREVVEHEPALWLDIGSRGVAIDFGLCDEQVILRVAGRQIFRHRYERQSTNRDTQRPLAIGSQGLALAVDELRVWRDIYYLAPDRTGSDWSAPPDAATSTVALLGDNTSVSVDSRHWTSGVLPSLVRGVVYQPFWAHR